MKSDGQLYSMQNKMPFQPPHRTSNPPCECESESVCEPEKNGFGIGAEELLIIGLILLLVTDRCEPDLPLLLALLYVLFLK